MISIFRDDDKQKRNPYILSRVFPVIRADGTRQWPRVEAFCFPRSRPKELCRWLPAVTKFWVIRRSALIPGPLCSAGGSGGTVKMWPLSDTSVQAVIMPSCRCSQCSSSTLHGSWLCLCQTVKHSGQKRFIRADIYVPGFGPSVPQQLEDGHLFRAEVSPQEVHSVSGEVRGDYWTHQFRTSTALQHLWTHSQG